MRSILNLLPHSTCHAQLERLFISTTQQDTHREAAAGHCRWRPVWQCSPEGRLWKGPPHTAATLDTPVHLPHDHTGVVLQHTHNNMFAGRNMRREVSILNLDDINTEAPRLQR